MPLADWSVSAGAWILDPVNRYEGASSVQANNVGANRIYYTGLQATQCYVRTRVRSFVVGFSCGVRHVLSYGEHLTIPPVDGNWHLYEAWLWYDAPSNTKFARQYLDGAAVGADANCGAGAPVLDEIELFGSQQMHYDATEIQI